MSQVDNRNPSTAKRARTDGGRREDDWTCPRCGNVNFSFRTTCNMRNCTQPRPPLHNVKSSVRPFQPPPYSANPPYGGHAPPPPPSSMYMGVPPYGPPIPPYDVPYSGGSAYHYNYGRNMSGGGPYRPQPLPGPPPSYAGGSMMPNGGMYGMPPPPMMDRYGMSMPHMTHPPMGPRPGFLPNDRSHKKEGGFENDWNCPRCGNVNFAFRMVCNMRKCNTPKPGARQKMPEGSWKCEECGNMNYPFRTKCNRHPICNADKPSSDETTSPSRPTNANEQ